MMHYILDEHHMPVEEPDLITWAKWFEKANRVVKQETIDGFFVSTVFLGLDLGGVCPLLFETMVFKEGSSTDLACERCSTWEEALAQHEQVASRVRAGIIVDELREALDK